jgi:hypothetical protein
MRVIEVTVSPTGETQIQTKGYSGGACLKASQFLQDALGVVESDRRTAEYHQSTEQQQEIFA